MFVPLFQVSIGVKNGSLVCYTETARARDPPLLSHSLSLIIRHILVHGNITTIGYFLKDLSEPILYCYLYQTTDPDDVSFSNLLLAKQTKKVIVWLLHINHTTVSNSIKYYSYYEHHFVFISSNDLMCGFK